MTTRTTLRKLQEFLYRPRPAPSNSPYTAVTMFSGAGLSDLGYEMAGIKIKVQVEQDQQRALVGQQNFPQSKWIIDDVREALARVVATCAATIDRKRPDLLIATPPCQGLSSSNPWRGNRSIDDLSLNAERNRLILEVVPYAHRLRPRVIVAENVSSVLTFPADDLKDRTILDALKQGLSEYTVFATTVNMADYGIPQSRRRAIVVAVRGDEPALAALKDHRSIQWPPRTHSRIGVDGLEPHITLRQWLRYKRYQLLDAGSKDAAHGRHPMHQVPYYDVERWRMVVDIPPMSGRSAWQNSTCPHCNQEGVPVGEIRCPGCDGVMTNRPYVIQEGKARLIRGFHSSYKRMRPDAPAAAIMTNSNRLGGAYKIHPWENRVLSPLECADIQTVPRCYDWSAAQGRSGLIRDIVGEALPPFFTYLHGQVLAGLLRAPAAQVA